MNKNRYIKIQQRGASLYLLLPAYFVRENDLNAGDWILWEPENFKIAKQSAIDAAIEPAKVPETATE